MFPMEKQNDSPIRFGLAPLLPRLQTAGFAVEDQGAGRIRVSKYGCAAVLEATASGEPQFATPPGRLLGERIAPLVDRGFQKFWQEEQRRLPALAEQLKSLAAFQKDLRGVMGMTTLYNEALGTVSSRYVYDRLEGRETGKRHRSFD